MSSDYSLPATVPMVPRDQLVELAELVKRMRRAQNVYFKSRHYSDKRYAMDYETRVDAAVAAVLDKPSPQQRTLFGGDQR